jgi:hypothetical protein
MNIKIVNGLSVLLLLGCQPPPAKKETTETKCIPTSTIVSKQVVVPDSISVPTSLPTSMQGSLAASLPVSEVYYLLETQPSKNGKYFTIFHPDPAIKVKLDALVKDAAESQGKSCQPKLISTAVISFYCESTTKMNGAHVPSAAYTYALKNGEFVAVSLSDLVSDSRALEPFLEAKYEVLPPAFDVFTLNVTDPGEDEGLRFSLAFYRGDSVPGGGISTLEFEDEDEDEGAQRLLKKDSWPLSLVSKTIKPPDDFVRPQTLIGQLKSLPFDPETLPESVMIEGKSSLGFHWEDKLGENYFILSSAERWSINPRITSVYLYANHYLKQGEVFVNVRKIAAKQEECKLKNKAEFYLDKAWLTDLDLDGIGEMSFSYVLGCMDQYATIPYRWFILENRKQYAFRGNLTYYTNNTYSLGKKRADAAFRELPSIFLRFGEFMWCGWCGVAC